MSHLHQSGPWLERIRTCLHQGLPFLKIITCPTSRILKFFNLLTWNKEEKSVQIHLPVGQWETASPAASVTNLNLVVSLTSLQQTWLMLFTPWRTPKCQPFSTDLADAVASMGLKDTPTSICCKVTDANKSLEFKIEPKMIKIFAIYVHSISYGIHRNFSQGTET